MPVIIISWKLLSILRPKSKCVSLCQISNTCREWLSRFRTSAKVKRIKHDKPQWNHVIISSAKVYGIMLIILKPLNVFLTDVRTRFPAPSRLLVERHRNRCRVSISKSVSKKNTSGPVTLNGLKAEWWPTKIDSCVVIHEKVMTNWTQRDQLSLSFFWNIFLCKRGELKELVGRSVTWTNSFPWVSSISFLPGGSDC